MAVFSTIVSARVLQGVEFRREDWVLTFVPRVADLIESVLLLDHGSLHVSIEELVLERVAMIVSRSDIQIVFLILISMM